MPITSVGILHICSKKVYEEGIFHQQDILQFFLGESKDYKHIKFAQML